MGPLRLATVLTVLVLAGSLLAPAASPAQKISNPDLFGKSLKAAEQARSFYGPYDNQDEERRLNEIGYRIARASGFTDFPFSFYLVDMPVPNAFALPGGHIFLTRGMLDLGLSDDMLAGLLGHEIGHVVGRHGTRMQNRATLLNVLSQVLLLGVMVSTSGGDSSPAPGPYPYPGSGSSQGDRVMGAAAAGMVVSELLLRSYSREFEDEADDEGQRMAAAAGFDPDGTRQLMALMRERLPESKQYGYWRTHPFFDQRVRAAAVREEMLKVEEPKPADDYRRRTQQVLLAYREDKPRKPDAKSPDLVKMAALAAWPIGEDAERLRLERLHQQRDAELDKRELYRDTAALIASYRREQQELRLVDPESKLLDALEREIGGFERQLEVSYPKAAEVFTKGVFETGFLETFQSNYPEAAEYCAVALALGDAYSRLERPADAVSQYLRAWRKDPDSDAGRRARTGLRNLATVLDRLRALQELAEIEEDSELRGLADRRLADLASSFKDLANGSEFLKRYPESPYADRVNDRLNSLADNLYGEVVLYQAVGDHVKALDRIQRILTDAPLSPAASRLRENAVFES